MSTFLFLAVRMVQGYGVSVAMEEMGRRIVEAGHVVVVGCIESDKNFPAMDIRHVLPDAANVRTLAQEVGADFIVAHTTPYFEVLPALIGEFRCWALEYGDPTSAFFTEDATIRAQIVLHKQLNVYPKLEGVMAISEFIRSDINYPAAKVLPLGCDHVPDLGPKSMQHQLAAVARPPLRVGTLMRLGVGEALYKGNSLFLQLREQAKAAGVVAEFFVMGRGTEADAQLFTDQSVSVFRNATEPEKADYLRNLDVFISCSMWEGFNLPLVEAQALGTVGIAFDVGAHPETTPFVVSSTDEIVSLLKAYDADRSLLLAHSRCCYSFVRRQFQWDIAVMEFLRCFRYKSNSGLSSNTARKLDQKRLKLQMFEARLRGSLKKNGIMGTAKKAMAMLIKKI